MRVTFSDSGPPYPERNHTRRIAAHDSLEEAVKVKSLAAGMILPLAASVALATEPAASAAPPTTTSFTQSGVRTDDHGYRYRCPRYNDWYRYYSHGCRLWHGDWWYGDWWLGGGYYGGDHGHGGGDHGHGGGDHGHH